MENRVNSEIFYATLIRVVYEVDRLELSKTQSHTWKGEPQSLHYRVPVHTLLSLFGALADFKKVAERVVIEGLHEPHRIEGQENEAWTCHGSCMFKIAQKFLDAK